MKRTVKTVLSLLLALLCIISLALPSLALVPPIQVSSTYASSIYYKQLLEVELTGDMRKDIMAVAQSQIGYLEGDYQGQVAGTVAGVGNYTEYNNYMYGGRTGGWCGMFISWCAAMAGIPTTILNRATSAKPYYYDGYGFNFISDKAGHPALSGSELKGFYDLPVKGGNYIPQAGDLIFFGYYNSKNVLSIPRSNYKHVGLVDYCDVTYDENGVATYMEIHTVEGNVSNKVRAKTYKMKPTSSGYVYEDTYIAAFGIPAYTTGNPENHPFYDIGAFGGTTLKSGVSNSAVITLQLALRVLSQSYPKIDAPEITGYYGDATKNAVTQYQKLKGLSVDGKCGPQSWASIRSTLIAETGKIAGNFVIDDDGSLLLYKGYLSDISLPENCKEIKSYAFYGKTVKSLTIQKGLKNIDKNAFSDVKSLEEVQFLGTVDEFSNLFVEKEGNSAFLNAEHIYKIKTYNITFDVSGTKTTIKCPENTLPVFSGSTDLANDGHRYFFTGWDKPLEPATKDTTYTATYYSISSDPILLTGSCNSKTFSKSGMSFDIYLKNTPGLSSFSFSTDYSMYLSDLTFASFSSAFSGVICDASIEGILKISYSGDSLPAGDLLVGTVYFDVSADLCFTEDETYPIQLFFFTTDGYLYHRLPNGSETEIDVLCDLVEIEIIDRFIYDYSKDGALSISDVTELLDILSTPRFDVTISSSLKTEDLTIGDVTNILDIMSYSPKEPS